MHEFWAFALVRFFAQLVDGALGMGFGVISAWCFSRRACLLPLLQQA